MAIVFFLTQPVFSVKINLLSSSFVWNIHSYSAKNLRRVLEILCGTFERCSRLHAMFRRKWTDLDEIWGTPSILFGAGPDRFRAQSAQNRQRESLRKFFVFFVGYIMQPNFTEFAHKTWFWEMVRSFGIIFWNFALKGFFPKNFQFCLIIVNDFRLPATISPKWLQILENDDRLARIRNVSFPSVPLGSTQSHSPGQHSLYTEWFSSMDRCQTAS